LKLRKAKRALNLVLVVLPFVYLGYIVADRAGVWDHLCGLDSVEQVAVRFQSSYAPDASHEVKVGDEAWEPLLRLMYRYSNASFPPDKSPRVLARSVAVASSIIPAEGPLIAEWTAPSTPLLLLYRDWPGNKVPPEDYRIIGTIGDLPEWINRARDHRRFIVQDLFLSIFTPLLALVVFWIEGKVES
jgi:hypothetical protein